MRGRITKLAAVLSVSPLALGLVSSASAATKAKPPQTKESTVKCALNTTIVVSSGSTEVLPPVAAGTDFGQTHCGGILGSGVEWDSFTVPSGGNTDARFWMYFGQGTVHGSYVLVPQESDSLNFLQTSWLGTLTVKGGSGAYRGVTGSGKLKCASTDGIHTSCTASLKLKAKVV